MQNGQCETLWRMCLWYFQPLLRASIISSSSMKINIRRIERCSWKMFEKGRGEIDVWQLYSTIILQIYDRILPIKTYVSGSFGKVILSPTPCDSSLVRPWPKDSSYVRHICAGLLMKIFEWLSSFGIKVATRHRGCIIIILSSPIHDYHRYQQNIHKNINIPVPSGISTYFMAIHTRKKAASIHLYIPCWPVTGGRSYNFTWRQQIVINVINNYQTCFAIPNIFIVC